VRARSVIVYSVLRLLAFLVPFGLLMLLPAFHPLPWLAALFAAIIGLALSMLFLRRPLAEATSGLAERRARRDGAADDAALEDAVVDEAEAAPDGDATR
jgi:hypothetical protein